MARSWVARSIGCTMALVGKTGGEARIYEYIATMDERRSLWTEKFVYTI